MKKVLFIAAILASSISFAQQEISPAQQELSKNISAMGRPHAAVDIAKKVIELVA